MSSRIERLANQHPRLYGALLLAVGALVAGVSLGVGRLLQDGFYPILLPLAGWCVATGLFQLAAGLRMAEVRVQRPPRPLTHFFFAVGILGVMVGLEVNKAVFGVRW